MLGWLRFRQRNDGFEWHEYVRTTVKLRREERKKKIEELRDAVADGAREAGRHGMAAGRHGIEASRHWMRRVFDSAVVWFGRLNSAAIQGLAVGVRGVAAGVRGLAVFSRGCDWPGRSIALSMRAKISILFGLLALLAGASTLMQIRKLSDALSAALSGGVALVLVGLALAPWIGGLVAFMRAGHRGSLLSRFKGEQSGWLKPIGFVAAVLAGGLIVFGGGAHWWFRNDPHVSRITTASISPSLPPLPSVKPSFEVPVPGTLSGTARAISGDTLAISGRVVRLDDIEAVELGQVCRDRRGRAWRCGQRARRVLRGFIGRKQVVCRDLARAGAGQLQGSCMADGEDLALRIVEAGYAFANGFLFRTYGDAEGTARQARRGIWMGEVDRPADYRAARWARAKARAPGGCPIKGQVKRGAKVYVVPWSPNYARARIRRNRGERWFCSEADAAAAGFVPDRSG